MSLEAWAVTALVAALCVLAAAAAVYLVARELHASSRTTAGGSARAVIEYREPALLPPLGGLRRVLSDVVIRGGPRIRIGGALAGLTGLVLVVTGAADIRLGGTDCSAVCVVRAQDSEQDKLDAISAPAMAQAAVSTQLVARADMQRGTSTGGNPGEMQFVVAASAVSTDRGSPIDGRGLVEQWTSRGLTVTAGDGESSCLEAGATPRPYRASRSGGGGQRAVLLVYPSASALNADWTVERGSPLGYRGRGACGRGGVVYWNQNAVLILPEVTDGTVRQILTETFFSAH